MNNLVLLVVCFVAGILLRRLRRMPDNAPATLNSFIIHVSLPALTLLYLHSLTFDWSILLVSAMPWLLFALATGFFLLAGRWLALPRSIVGALILTGGMANTAFYGLPMVEAYYGHAGIATAIVIDQLGSFLVLSTLGIAVAGTFSSGIPSAGRILKRIALFPPAIAFVVALALRHVEYADWFSALLKRLGDTLAPLALLSVGLQLRISHVSQHKKHLVLGLAFKLLLAPLALSLTYLLLLGAHGLQIRVTLFEAAMPPMISAAIVAAEHDLEPELSSLMVAVGLVVSFFTLAGWWYLLQGA